MNDQPTVYTPPEQHNDHIRKMVIWLTVFFGALTVLVILVLIFAGPLAKKLPFSAEKRFVRPYEAMADYFADDDISEERVRVQDYLTSLGDDLAQRLNVPEDYRLEFHYIDDETENAFATLGGHIFIFRGLIEAAPDENSLAMILSHEIAHIRHRDPLAAMGRLYALQLVYSFASGDYGSGLGITIDGTQLGLLYFSREQEEAADLAALNAINEKYGHVAGFDSFFSFIIDKYRDDNADQLDTSLDLEEWLSSHPRLEKRIETLEKTAGDLGYRLSGETQPLPDSLLGDIEEIEKQSKRKKRRKKK